MPKGKSKSRSSPVFVKGGKSGGMVTQQHAGPQMAGVTSTMAKGDGGKWGKGGSGHMTGNKVENAKKA